MSANRGKFVSNIAALRPTDALATPGRSVDGFEGVLRRGLCLRSGCCSLRGGGLFCVAAREAGWDVGKAGGTAGGGNARKSRRLQEVQFAAIPQLCDRWMLSQRLVRPPAEATRPPVFSRPFLHLGLCPRSGGCSLRGGGLFVGKAGGTAEAGMSASRGKFVSSIAALRLERTLPQRPAGLPPVFSRPFLRRGLCPRPGACPHRGAGLFAWRRAKRGGALAKRAERLGTGLFAWRRAATVTTFG